MDTQTVKPEKERIIIYHAARRKDGGIYFPLDEQGKKIPKVDPQTGAQMRMDGRLQFENKAYNFIAHPKSKMESPHCVFTLSEKNPDFNALKIALDARVKSGDVMTEDDWRKTENPQEFIARKELEKANAKVSELEKEKSDLQRKIAEIEGTARNQGQRR